MSLKQKILKLVENTIVTTDYDLKSLKLSPLGTGVLIALRMDKKEGRITVGECAKFNRRLRNLIEEQALIQEEYQLEVSSPGIE